MDHHKFQDKYKICKIEVKLWEKEFKKKWNRVPSKYDIREAPQNIRDAYKTYYKLKTTFLQNTLNDALSEDEMDAIDSIEQYYGLQSDSYSGPQLPNDISSLIQVNQIAGRMGLQEKDEQSDDRVDSTFNNTEWSDYPSNQKKVLQKAESKLSKCNFNNRLFKSSSYSKRNPRKSVSLNIKSCGASFNIQSKETVSSRKILPDLETLLTQKVEQNLATSINVNPLFDDKSKSQITTNVDTDWLKRTSNDCIGIMKIDEISENNSKKDNFGLSNIKLTKIMSTVEKYDIKDNVKIEPVIREMINEGMDNIISKCTSEKSESESIVSDSEDELSHENNLQLIKRRKLQTDIETHNTCTKLEESYIKNNEVNVMNAQLNVKKAFDPEFPKKLSSKEEIVNFTNINERSENSPPHPEDVTCQIILDNQNIRSNPRIRMSDFENMNKMLQKYIDVNTNTGRFLTNNQSRFNEQQETAKKKLKEKIAAGKLNDNFITLNIQRKKYVRGKQTVNYSKYKKHLWKSKKNALSGPNMNMNGCDGGILKCFNCGQEGHFEKNCKIEGDILLPVTAALYDDDSIFLSLQEAKVTAKYDVKATQFDEHSKIAEARNLEFSKSEQNEICNNIENSKKEPIEEVKYTDLEATEKINVASNTKNKLYIGHHIPNEFLVKTSLDTISLQTGDAFYQLKEDGNSMDVTPEVLEALHLFGHTNFRKGQDRAIMRILSGLSTLVTLSTGSGKSLCYQLPAYLYSRHKKFITLVISPLVSLMEDQITDIPHFLRAQCLHTNQTPEQRMKTLKMINNKELDILLVSPETVVASERASAFGSILRQLPPIAFACIDEAHCVSQWSHNFRPSYLMICKVLKNSLGVKTILGLTATATLPTRLSIIDHLGICDGEKGIISDIPIPDNLVLSVSHDENRDKALLDLFFTERFMACQSIIVYCTRREECERIAALLRTSFQDESTISSKLKSSKRTRSKWYAEPYHAGMSASRRRVIQNAFMKNELRIVVATIAFGMGINKSDIRAIIHYNMPRNFESYVQEVGRAGRDGKPSYCHLFLHSNGNDCCELRKHIYANSIDRYMIRKLLLNIFIPCSCDMNTNDSVLKMENHNTKRVCSGHEIGFSIKKTIASLDIPEENIATLLCYLELDTKWQIKMLSTTYIMAKVISYSGSKYLRLAAKECPPLAMAIAIQMKNNTFKDDINVIEFPVIEIAAAIGWNSGVVKYTLKKLEWTEDNGIKKRSTISVNFFDLGFHLNVPGNFTQKEIDEILDTLYNRAKEQEKSYLMQLQHIWESLYSVSCNTFLLSIGDMFNSRSDKLKNIIRKYFQDEYPRAALPNNEISTEEDESIKNDIHGLLNMYPENKFYGRTIARIFHGISSPNYPAVVWSRCRYWRAHKTTNFYHIIQLANAIIIKNRNI